jgi:cell division protein FtsW
MECGTTRAAKSLGPDPFLLTVILLILTIGVVMVTSAGYIIAAGKFSDGLYYTKKQGFAMLLGLGVMYLFSMVNPNFWRRAAVPLMGLGMILLALVFVPGLGVEMGGSRRWVRLPFGFYLQPSEFIKYALIMFIAGSLAKKGTGIKDFAVGFLPHVLVMGIVVFFILRQPDFGTAVMLTVVGFLMLFIAGGKLQHLFGCAVLCLPFLFQVAVSAPYRILRLKTYLDPWHDPLNSGFQIIQSLVAFGCGGLWGVGVGKGIQKLFYLPQPHTDFIFAVVGEELGLVGVVLVILLFYLLICRGLTVAIRCGDSFQRYLAFGITSLVGLQAFVNMAVTMGMLPTKGLPLPLVSLGGTSLVMNLAGIGILMAITRTAQANAEGEKL